MDDEHDHVVPVGIYLAVLAMLMVLLTLTLIAAFYDLDAKFGGHYWNVTVAILIAMSKALLIILFFMHVKYASKVTWAFAGAAFVWLGIMMTLSLSDYMTRQYPSGTPVTPQVHPDITVIPSPN